MLDHIGFGVSDIDLSHDFFIKALAPLGVSLVMQGPTSLGLGRQGKPSLWLYSGTHVSAPLHIAISADDHAQVDAFHRAALAAGGKDNGPPGLRPHYHPHYYAAFVISPDGHNLEAVCHRPQG
ncbi:VOC family protein [Achromobacter deleyi]|uniref:VOC family protein n=1 Tax=Achromobacter deleyi TaxID=1353891 RepID=A0A7T4B7P1_9BURK|nr:VOC family protein [Achromobacter deleyi]QQB37230.1 VOC family protein [Achromobacter deleyi]